MHMPCGCQNHTELHTRPLPNFKWPLAHSKWGCVDKPLLYFRSETMVSTPLERSSIQNWNYLNFDILMNFDRMDMVIWSHTEINPNKGEMLAVTNLHKFKLSMCAVKHTVLWGYCLRGYIDILLGYQILQDLPTIPQHPSLSSNLFCFQSFKNVFRGALPFCNYST